MISAFLLFWALCSLIVMLCGFLVLRIVYNTPPFLMDSNDWGMLIIFSMLFPVGMIMIMIILAPRVFKFLIKER